MFRDFFNWFFLPPRHLSTWNIVPKRPRALATNRRSRVQTKGASGTSQAGLSAFPAGVNRSVLRGRIYPCGSASGFTKSKVMPPNNSREWHFVLLGVSVVQPKQDLVLSSVVKIVWRLVAEGGCGCLAIIDLRQSSYFLEIQTITIGCLLVFLCILTDGFFKIYSSMIKYQPRTVKWNISCSFIWGCVSLLFFIIHFVYKDWTSK